MNECQPSSQLCFSEGVLLGGCSLTTPAQNNLDWGCQGRDGAAGRTGTEDREPPSLDTQKPQPPSVSKEASRD